MLTDDGRWTTDDARRTTHDDGRQPIAIGHLSDSGDLKICNTEWSSFGQAFEEALFSTRFPIMFTTVVYVKLKAQVYMYFVGSAQKACYQCGTIQYTLKYSIVCVKLTVLLCATFWK